MNATMYRYEVWHPEFGTVVVNAISEATAIQAAIRYWGACDRGHMEIVAVGFSTCAPSS